MIEKYPDKEHRYIFLTLIKESHGEDWVRISYFDILNKLKDLKLDNNKHSVFVEDYILYLTRLLSVLNEVIEIPKEYDYVFKNGSLKKQDKLNLVFKDSKTEFIAKNQLESIFQKAYLTNLLDRQDVCNCDINITDTRGVALVDFILKKDISIGGKRLYNIFIQLQDDNIKFAFANQDNYLKSKKEWIPEVIEVFKTLKNENNCGYNKINTPKSKAYVSISKKMNKPYWDMDIKEFSKMLNDEIKIGEKLKKITLEKINKTI